MHAEARDFQSCEYRLFSPYFMLRFGSASAKFRVCAIATLDITKKQTNKMLTLPKQKKIEILATQNAPIQLGPSKRWA